MATPSKHSKRSTINPEFKTPLPTNDDDLERSLNRSTFNDDSRQSTLALEENEELKTCLQQFVDNKINKENAWQNPLIDTLAKLVTGHRKYVKNFQMVGQSLEASSKIYGLRVDIVHNEVIRMSNGLTRMNAEQQTQNENDNNNDSIEQENQEPGERPAPVPKRRKKQSSTITKCKSLINAKLETIPFLDPIYANLKSNLGDITSSKNAFLNTLESDNSELLFDSEQPFWDRTPNTINTEEKEEKFIIMKYQKCKYPVKLRTIFSGYHITDKPCSMNDLLQPDYESEDKDFEDHEDAPIQNTNLAFAFDMNADVEPVPETQNFIEMDDYDEFSRDEIEALNTCAGIKRAPIMIDNMQPGAGASRQKLEYSYRPLNEISKFWAGPSYWKFKPSINRASQSLHEINHQQPRLKNRRVKKFTLLNVEDNISSNVIKPFDPKMKTKNIMKNWDPKKLKLPINYHVEDNYFEKLTFAIGVRLKDEECETPDPNGLDISSHSANQLNRSNTNLNVINEENDDNIFTDDHHHGDDDVVNFSIIKTTQDGPAHIEKIVIPYATRAKIVNMKQLKGACSQVVNHKSPEQTMRELDENDRKYLKKAVSHLKNQNETYIAGNCTFYEVYSNLPKHLNKQMQDNLSVPLAFSAMLHLANEQNLRFVPMDEQQHDFKIVKVKPFDCQT